MTSREILVFVNKAQACWLATAEGDQPHVRGMMMWYADETGFYFHTASCKRLASQLQKNPKVEMAFYNPGEGSGAGQMIRVMGRAEVATTPALIEKLYRDRPWVKGLADSMPGAHIVIFRIGNASAQYWDMSVNGRESLQPQIKL